MYFILNKFVFDGLVGGTGRDGSLLKEDNDFLIFGINHSKLKVGNHNAIEDLGVIN